MTPANANLHIATAEDAVRLNNRLVEAARYALLQRLAPAIRHDIAGALQPLGMVAKVLDKRLQQSQIDVAALIKCSNTIGLLVQGASAASMHLMSWLACKAGEKLSASVGIHEALKLLSTDLMLRGFAVDFAATTVQAELEASALRQVFSACLIALTDAGQAPAQVSVTLEDAEADAKKGTEIDVLISITIEPAAGEVVDMALERYRPLQWDEVQLLARAEGIKLHRLANGAQLRFSR